MHRRLLNQATLSVVLEPQGPVLIKSGVETPDPTRPSMEFVRTRHAKLGETVYLPGTSLKRAIRSQAERVLAGLGVAICDPLHRTKACHRTSPSLREASEPETTFHGIRDVLHGPAKRDRGP